MPPPIFSLDLPNQNLDLSNENLDQLIQLVYKTLDDEKVWREFLQRVCVSVDGDFVHLLAMDKRLGAFSYNNGLFGSGQEWPAIAEMNLLQKYHAIDPRIPHIFNKPLLEWSRDHEYFSDEFMDSDPFYQEYLHQYGVSYVTGAIVADDEQAAVMFAILTSKEKGPLSAAAMAFLDKLKPHISRAFFLRMQHFVYSTQALVGHTLVNKLRQPVILASVKGDVVHINDAAHKLLGSTRLLTIKAGKLTLPSPFQEVFFEDCARLEVESRAESSTHDTAAFKSLQISDRDQNETLYAFYSMLLPQRMLGTFGLRPLVMLFFYHTESAPSIDPALLTAAFNLTPAECRIAILLGDGLSQKEIAHTLGIRPDTVRKQLQVIYHKTATKQQSELIRLMLHLPSNFVQQPIKPALPPA